MKLNIGCGYGWNAPGWIGIDYDGTSAVWSNGQGNHSYLNIDILKGLPFENYSVDIIFCSHMLEHFTYNEAILVVAEFYRVLKPEGILALIVPDLDIYLDKFHKKDEEFLTTPDIIGGNPLDNYTDNFLMNFYSDPIFNNTCHKYSYNFENLSSLLQKFKFKDIKRAAFMQFEYDNEINLDTFRPLPEHAEQFSLCVECRKPNSDFDYSKENFYIKALKVVNKNRTIDELLQEIQTNKIVIKSLNQQIEEYKIGLETLTAENNNLKFEISQLRKELAHVEELKNKAEDAFFRLNNSLENEKQKNQVLQKQLKNFENLKKDYLLLIRDFQQLQCDNQDIKRLANKFFEEKNIVTEELNKIYSSNGWRLLTFLYRIRDKLY